MPLPSPPGAPAASDSLPAAGTLLTAVGWGKLSEGGADPTVLQEVGLGLVGQSDCTTQLGATEFKPAAMICAGGSHLLMPMVLLPALGIDMPSQSKGAFPVSVDLMVCVTWPLPRPCSRPRKGRVPGGLGRSAIRKGRGR